MNYSCKTCGQGFNSADISPELEICPACFKLEAVTAAPETAIAQNEEKLTPLGKKLAKAVIKLYIKIIAALVIIPLLIFCYNLQEANSSYVEPVLLLTFIAGVFFILIWLLLPGMVIEKNMSATEAILRITLLKYLPIAISKLKASWISNRQRNVKHPFDKID